MTTTEFNNEFDILYNSIATNAAPNLDKYEKSVYLTKAQLEIVKNYFNPKGNKYQEGFENSSKRRIDLKQLISQNNSTNKYYNENNINQKSRFFKIPNDVFLIINERAKFGESNYISYLGDKNQFIDVNVLNNPSNIKGIILRDRFKNEADKCLDNKIVNIKPKKHDEINIQINNPFKKPDKNIVWRIDFNQHIGDVRTVEIVSEYPVKEYLLRYIKYPKPIILTNLEEDFPEENLTIDGESNEQTCKLDNSIHREILDRAIELAMADYRPEMLQVKTQVNNRNE